MISPRGRVIFHSIYQPSTFGNGKPSYELTLLFPKSDPGWKKIQAEMEKAAKEKWPDMPFSKLKFGLKDGDEEKGEYEMFRGMMFARFKSHNPPDVRGPDMRVLTETSGGFYDGCYARVSFSPYAYEYTENGKVMSRGVSLWLNNVQKLADGEAFAKRPSADDEFDAVAETDLEAVNDLLS